MPYLSNKIVSFSKSISSTIEHSTFGRFSISYRTLTTFKLEGEVTSLSGRSQREVGRLLGEVKGYKPKHCFATPLKIPCPN